MHQYTYTTLTKKRSFILQESIYVAKLNEYIITKNKQNTRKT